MSKGKMPRELKLALSAQKWGVLPSGGGLWDQPAGLIKRMEQAHAAYEVIMSRKRANGAISWIDADPQRYEYYSWVKMIVAEHG